MKSSPPDPAPRFAPIIARVVKEFVKDVEEEQRNGNVY